MRSLAQRKQLSAVGCAVAVLRGTHEASWWCAPTKGPERGAGNGQRLGALIGGAVERAKLFALSSAQPKRSLPSFLCQMRLEEERGCAHTCCTLRAPQRGAHCVSWGRDAASPRRAQLSGRAVPVAALAATCCGSSVECGSSSACGVDVAGQERRDRRGAPRGSTSARRQRLWAAAMEDWLFSTAARRAAWILGGWRAAAGWRSGHPDVRGDCARTRDAQAHASRRRDDAQGRARQGQRSGEPLVPPCRLLEQATGRAGHGAGSSDAGAAHGPRGTGRGRGAGALLDDEAGRQVRAPWPTTPRPRSRAPAAARSPCSRSACSAAAARACMPMRQPTGAAAAAEAQLRQPHNSRARRLFDPPARQGADPAHAARGALAPRAADVGRTPGSTNCAAAAETRAVARRGARRRRCALRSHAAAPCSKACASSLSPDALLCRAHAST